LELVSELFSARWIFGRVSGRADRADGSAVCPVEIRKAGETDRRRKDPRTSWSAEVKPMLVDLEMAWRGGQNQALLILKGLKARGHEPELVAARGSALGERAAETGVPVHSVRRGLLNLPAANAVRRLIQTGRFELVHANEAHAVSAVWLAGAHRRVPFVISRRVGYPIGQGKFARARYNAAAKIVANSNWVAEQTAASGAQRQKIAVVYEGAEIPLLFTVEQRAAARAKWNQPEGAPLLGCVGVLLPDKGQEWLIRGLAELRAEFRGIRLLLAGDGPSRSKLEKLARELNVSDAVIFSGFVKDVENVYAALDVFLLPSFFEALNNSLLAAMAYEIPSIAYRRGALGEIIEHENSGLLVEVADTKELCGGIRRILGNPELANQFAQMGRKRVEEKFSADRMVEGILDVYRQVAANS
jgi:L-malate glycosyltransferase